MIYYNFAKLHCLFKKVWIAGVVGGGGSKQHKFGRVKFGTGLTNDQWRHKLARQDRNKKNQNVPEHL